MNNRQRLEAIVAVVCKYLPPDGISREDAMREIISLVDPLPELAKPEQEPVRWFQQFGDAPPRKEWVGLTREEIVEAYCSIHVKEWAIGGMDDVLPFTRAIEAKLKEKNT